VCRASDEFPRPPEPLEIVGINPFALEHASLVVLDAGVATSSGSYEVEVEIVTTLPWPVASGVRNVPLGLRVLLHGKDQASYDWTLTAAGGSGATLPTLQPEPRVHARRDGPVHGPGHDLGTASRSTSSSTPARGWV